MLKVPGVLEVLEVLVPEVPGVLVPEVPGAGAGGAGSAGAGGARVLPTADCCRRRADTPFDFAQGRQVGPYGA